ncbi:TRAP transporter small permease [Fodinicurvata halophila]|uniref:TRAP transporter small permease protein n=1 Tax=Fodinicurvata halophila TaxID=1419723 RepID=A0ABV8UML9_9PROT
MIFMPLLHKPLDTISLWVGRIVAAVVCVTAVALVATLLIGVFFRYVLHSSLPWPSEISLLLFSWTVLLAASLGVREDFHVRVTLLRDLLPGVLSDILERLILLGVGIFALAMLYYGWQFAEFTAGRTSAAINYPLWLRNASVPVAGAFMLLHVLARLTRPSLREAGSSGKAAL